MSTLSVNTINPLSGNNLVLSGSNVAIPGDLTVTGSIALPTTQSTIPAWIGTDGEIIPATVGGKYLLYMWMNGAWRSGSFA